MTSTEFDEFTAPARGADLCVQAIGDPGAPPVVLVQGLGGAMDWWEDDLCRLLADGGRRVVRYDHRDTGRSTCSPPGAPAYTGPDLADDLVAVLDAAGIAAAHVVGLSMGGGLAQLAALTHPERIKTLTLASTSPIGPRPDGLDLPGPTEQLMATLASPPPEPDWDDTDAVIAHLVDGFRPYAGSGPFDEAELRATAARVVARSTNIASAGNHALMDHGPDVTRPVSEITAPTLIVHGAEDPLLPLPHGEALAHLIPRATLLTLPHTGHELPRHTWATLVPALLTHTTA